MKGKLDNSRFVTCSDRSHEGAHGTLYNRGEMTISYLEENIFAGKKSHPVSELQPLIPRPMKP